MGSDKRSDDRSIKGRKGDSFHETNDKIDDTSILRVLVHRQRVLNMQQMIIARIGQ